MFGSTCGQLHFALLGPQVSYISCFDENSTSDVLMPLKVLCTQTSQHMLDQLHIVDSVNSTKSIGCSISLMLSKFHDDHSTVSDVWCMFMLCVGIVSNVYAFL